MSTYSKEYYQKNKEKMKASARKYQIEHRDRINERNRFNYLNNINGKRDKTLKYLRDHKEHYALYHKEYYKKNKEVLMPRLVENTRKWREKNWEHYLAWSRDYKKRKKNLPV